YRAEMYQTDKEVYDALKTYFNDKKIIMVMAMLKDKEYEKCIRTIAPVVDTFIATEAKNPRKATADEIAETAKKYISNVYAEADINKAVEYAKTISDHNTVICICGSLYLLGDVDI
ncbi:MAG: hypothetical protein UH854_06710, partial [Clostridia bacterium]|nr:hypothetical protein [Clostridia bacterium]